MPRVLLAFEPPDGGVAECVGRIALGAAAHGWDVEVAGPVEALPYPALTGAGIPIHRLPFARGYGSPGADAAALRGLVRLLRTGRFDAVHLHSAKAGVVGRLAARITGTPALYSPHCFPFIGEFGTPRRVFATAVEVVLGHLGATVVCVCEAERRIGLRHRVAPRRRLAVVLNGSPACPEGVEPDPALVALGAGGPVAAAITVLRAQKTVDVLLDAAPLVFAALPQARVAVVGDGPLRDALHAQAAALGLDADERFAFLPFAAPAARHLAAADVYVLPSAWEALPIGALEALACGTPQVVTDVGGTGEAVSPATGLLVAPHDPRALAAAIVELLSDPARRDAMSAASRARHAERFTVERMVGETVALYDAAIADGR